MLAEMTKLFNFLLFERVESDAACWTLLGMDKSWNILPSRYTIMYNLELFSKKTNNELLQSKNVWFNHQIN